MLKGLISNTPIYPQFTLSHPHFSTLTLPTSALRNTRKHKHFGHVGSRSVCKNKQWITYVLAPPCFPSTPRCSPFLPPPFLCLQCLFDSCLFSQNFLPYGDKKFFPFSLVQFPLKSQSIFIIYHRVAKTIRVIVKLRRVS